MHEAGLQVNAQEHPEPDQVNAHLVGDWREHRHDDEGDLKKVEKERQKKHEHIHHNQKTDLPTWQTGQHMLYPLSPVYPLKHLTEHTRADQNKHHHRG